MKLILKKLVLENFKKLKSQTVEFSSNTDIYLMNKGGKTTIFDAFLWLLSGKNSLGQADFDVKTNNSDGSPLHNLNHSVEGFLEIDKKPVLLKKTFREKWSTKRGQSESKLTSHTTDYCIDTVPVTKKQFDSKVELLIDPAFFKMLTDPRYFNEQMKWGDRRVILTEMCEEVKNVDVPGYDVISNFLGDKTIEDQAKIVAAQKKKIEEEKLKIPPAIQENYAYITDDILPVGILQKSKLRAEQDEFKRQISQIVSDSGIHARAQKIAEIDTAIIQLENEFSKNRQEKIESIFEKISVCKFKINKIRNSSDKISLELNSKNKIIKSKNQENDKLRENWNKLASAPIPEFDDKCPACSQSLPQYEIQAASESHRKTKSEQLEHMKSTGLNLNSEIENLQFEIKVFPSALAENESKISTLTKKLFDAEQEKQAVEKLVCDTSKLDCERKAIVDQNVVSVDTQDLENKIQTIDDLIQNDIDLRKRVADNLKYKERIKYLESEEKRLAQEFADLENQIFQIEQFVLVKSKKIEKEVNKLFEFAKFKMFEDQINGGTNPICKTMMDGALYGTALNNAGKTQVGVDIIRTLQKRYGISLPIWIDNREGITELPDVDCQLISLYVSPEDKTIRIEHG